MLSKSNPLAGRDGASLPGHALRHDLSLERQFSHVFRKGAKKMWMGSVAQRVVRLASYPVFVCVADRGHCLVIYCSVLLKGSEESSSHGRLFNHAGQVIQSQSG